jgi:hypothetical protein
MEEHFKIVRMHGPRDEVIARVQNFPDPQSGVREGAVRLSGCHSEMRQGARTF